MAAGSAGRTYMLGAGGFRLGVNEGNSAANKDSGGGGGADRRGIIGKQDWIMKQAGKHST